EDYSRALLAIDHEVAELIQQGKEMQALMVLTINELAILKVHESLQTYYGIILKCLGALKRFGSERLKQLGHEPITLRLEALLEAGYTRTHWFIDPLLMQRIDYMLDALDILVEPEFVPLETSSKIDNEEPDRYIPSSVKITVWRRDEGRCVQCKSREK